MKANTWLPQAIFLALFVACFASVVLWSYKRETRGLNPRVLMVLTIGALIIPAVSYDYKLAVLPAAIALWFPTAFAMDTRRNTLASILLAFLFSFSYASLLFPPTNKPPWLAYNLPVLLLLLVIVVAADFVLPADVTADTTDSVETNDHGRDWEGSRGACV